MNITELRKQIDEVDHAIIDLITKRFEYVKDIGALKKIERKDPLDTDRFRQVLIDRVAYARERGVDKKIIETIWHEIHNHALEIETSNE